MNIDEFVWLPEIIDKLVGKHHVTPEEVEQVFGAGLAFAITRRGASKARTCTPPLGKPMQAVT